MRALSNNLQIHVLTADTFGRAATNLKDLPCELHILSTVQQDVQKQAYIEKLGAEKCVCVGNGRNDRLMLEAAALGIALVQSEGAATQTILASDILCPDVHRALELLRNPKRLIATLRS